VADFQPKLGLITEKAKITANGDYNLSGERYRDTISAHTQWPVAPLSEICEFRSGLWKGEKEPLRVVKILRNTNFTKTGFLNTNDIAEHPVEVNQLESRLLQYGDIILEKSGGGPTQPVGRVAIFNIPNGEYSYSNFTTRIRVIDERADSFFVWLILNYFYQMGITEGLQKQTSGIRNLDNTAYQQLQIPLPPLDVQKEIVAEIEGYQKVIDGAYAVINNYRPRIPFHPDWPMVELGKACETIMDGTHFSPSNTETGDRLYITSKNVRENYLDLSNVSYISEEDHREIYSRCPVRTGDVLYVKDGANAGIAAINTLKEEFSLLSSVAVLRGKPDVLENRYLAFFLNSDKGRQSMLSMISGVAITRLTLTKLNSALVPLPPLDMQQSIVAEIEAEQALVKANRELITRFEKKIHATLAGVWGKEASPVAES